MEVVEAVVEVEEEEEAVVVEAHQHPLQPQQPLQQQHPKEEPTAP